MKLINAGVAVVLVLVLGVIGISPKFASSSQSKLAPTASDPGQKVYLPIFFSYRPSAPIYSTSYYMLTVDSSTLYNMGCKLGQYDQDLAGTRETVVVLDFGSPKKVGSEYGADLFWMGPVSITQITNAVKNFGMGY